MKKFLILIITILFLSSFSKEEKITYYYYCFYIERATSPNLGFHDESVYGKDYKPKMWYTIVKSVECDWLDYTDKGISNVFHDYLEAKYGKLPYGDWGARVYKSRKEAEERRLQNIKNSRKYTNYQLTELLYFNYYCD